MAPELPFNAGEIFGRKGASKVKGKINREAYECSLIHRGKGIYLFP
ncbi:DUF1905 domain-containing protein [Brucepastera parasyntrophica]|nr:DUF1905 domain-containing protein [Brucepastera parasyntrophica]